MTDGAFVLVAVALFVLGMVLVCVGVVLLLVVCERLAQLLRPPRGQTLDLTQLSRSAGGRVDTRGLERELLRRATRR